MKTVFFGDSITAGFIELKNHSNVINLGVSGNKINNLIGRIESVVVEKPDQLLLMIGINDFLFAKGYWGEPLTFDFKALYIVLLKLLNENLPNCQVILLPILPISIDLEESTLKEYNDEITKRNIDIESLAVQFEYTYANLVPQFIDSKGFLESTLTKDGVHLSQKGYQIYYNLIKHYLK